MKVEYSSLFVKSHYVENLKTVIQKGNCESIYISAHPLEKFMNNFDGTNS